MRIPALCFLYWKIVIIASDHVSKKLDVITHEVEALEQLHHPFQDSSLRLQVLDNQTEIDEKAIHGIATEAKLNLEKTRSLHGLRRRRRRPSRSRLPRTRSGQIRSRQYNTYLGNKVILLQRTVAELTMSLKKTKAKVKSYEKWQSISDKRFRRLEGMVEQLQRRRDEPSPGAIEDERNLVHPNQDQSTPAPIMFSNGQGIILNSNRRNWKRTVSSNFSLNAHERSYHEIVKTVLSLNVSVPMYRRILYNLNNKVTRFSRYVITRQTNVQRRVFYMINNTGKEIKKINSKLSLLSNQLEDGRLIDSISNSTIHHVMDEVLPRLMNLGALNEGLIDLNTTYYVKIEALNQKVSLNKATILAWSNMMRNARVSNVRIRKSYNKLRNTVNSLKDSTQRKILEQTKQVTNVVKKVAGMQALIQTLNQSLEAFQIRNAASNYVQNHSLIEATVEEDFGNNFGSTDIHSSTVAAIQTRLEKVIGKCIESKMNTVIEATKDLKKVKSDLNELTESVQQMNKSKTHTYMTMDEYQAGIRQVEQRIDAVLSQKIGEYQNETLNTTTILKNQFVEFENSRFNPEHLLRSIDNASKILREQMARLHFFRAFVFLKLGSVGRKNLSEMEDIISRMRKDIDFNYNSTQLITDYIEGQNNRISILFDEMQNVMLLSESIDEQKISLEELNYTLSARINHLSSLLTNFMAAFDTSSYVVKRLDQDLNFMKKNTSNHFIRTLTNLDYLTQIIKATNIAVEENSFRIQDLNRTLLYLEISDDYLGTSVPDEDLALGLGEPIFSSEPSADDSSWNEPGKIQTSHKTSKNGRETRASNQISSSEVGQNDTEESASAYDEDARQQPRNRFARSVLKWNDDLVQTASRPRDHTREVAISRISRIARQAVFSVGLISDFDCCGPVKFNKIYSNKGEGYDTCTGKFTAEEPGYYAFFISIARKNRFVHAALVHNGVPTISFRMERSTKTSYSQNQSSNSVILILTPGDEVWLQTYSGSLKSYQSPSTTFSGFYIAE